jgi:hypothetical protein
MFSPRNWKEEITCIPGSIIIESITKEEEKSSLECGSEEWTHLARDRFQHV